jgi:hypothetical protein
MSKGTVVLNEIILPIFDVTFAAGQVLIHTEAVPGPACDPGETEVRVHAPDGSLVIVALTEVPRVHAREGDVLHYVFPLVLGDPRWDER